MKRLTGMLAVVGLGLLLVGGLPGPAAAVTSITSCGSYGSNTSLRLDADLSATGANCLTLGSGVTLDMNGHSITGLNDGDPVNGIGITAGGNTSIKGPGIVAFFGDCIKVGNFSLIESVLAYNCEFTGITLGNASKCVQCRVHDIVEGVGITMGDWCLLESSIVEVSHSGAVVGHNCKIWDLVVDTIDHIGLDVNGGGTAVARTVISHVHDGPGIDYCGCDVAVTPVGTLTGTSSPSACQDSSNSVYLIGGNFGITDGNSGITGCAGQVVTDCATNNEGDRYPGTTPAMTGYECDGGEIQPPV